MSGIARLTGYLWRYWRRYLLGGLCLLGTTILLMVIPWWVRAAINVVDHGDPQSQLGRYVLLIVLAAIGGGLMRALSRSLIFNAGRNVEYDLRNDLFAHLEKLPLSYYQTQSTGDLMSRAINDINAVRQLLGPGFLNLVNTPLYFIYAAIFMFAMDARLTVAVIAVLTILMVVFRLFRGRIQQASLRVQQEMAALSAHVQENLSGMHVVKAYVQERHQTERFVDLNAEYKTRSMELARYRGLINPMMTALGGFTVLIVLWYGGWLTIRGQMNVADLVAFILYLNYLAWPMAAFGWMISLLERGRAAMERLEEIFEVKPVIADPVHPIPLAPSSEGIEFSDVSYSYEGAYNGDAALRDISFKVAPGRKLAIVGRTGSGKSTIAHLIPRLYDVTAGEIRVGGVDIRSLSLKELRRSIGYAPQDPFLFSTSLDQNLRFGRDRATAAEIDAAVKTAGLEHEVEIFPKGLNTLVGERGISLSGGQKQRVALARAIVADPAYLILDDCLSSVDSQTEQKILESFETSLGKKTCIVISHRIAAIKDADEIIVLDEGRVAERGDHESLLRADGIYAQMYRHQQVSEELERM
jgi:ATP-binding cassette subfamily B multidrug efflux pump